MKIIKFVLPIIVAAMFIGGCSLIKNDKPATLQSVTLDLTGLPQLPDTSYKYSLWTWGANHQVSLKLFDFAPDANGNIHQDFDVNTTTMQAGAEYWITIQKKYYGSDSATNHNADSLNKMISKAAIAGGVISGNYSTVDFSYYLGNFKGADLRYALYSPTDSLNPDQPYGIYFANGIAADTSVKADTIFNVLPSGWYYRAMLTDGGKNYLVAEFNSPNGNVTANEYGAGRVASKDKIFGKVPGGDFVANAPSGVTFPLDVRNKTLTVYLIPVFKDVRGNRDSAAINAMTFKVWEGTISGSASTKQALKLPFVNPVLPKGTIKFNFQI